MSCLALTLTCKSQPLWLQTVLQNDVKPAQYETEIARLNAQVALLQRQRDEQRLQLELLQVQQRLVCGNQTWQEYGLNHRNKYVRLENHLHRVTSQASGILVNAHMTMMQHTGTPAYTAELSEAHNAICNTMRTLDTEPAQPDEEESNHTSEDESDSRSDIQS